MRGIDQKETITVFSTHVESVTVLERTDKQPVNAGMPVFLIDEKCTNSSFGDWN